MLSSIANIKLPRSSGKSNKQKQLFQQRLEEVWNKPENQYCIDCDEKNTSWASILAPVHGTSKRMAVFCCYKCCNYHMALGREVCLVKNIKTADDWTEEEIRVLECGGNDITNIIYEGNLSTPKPSPSDYKAHEVFITRKYKKLSFFCLKTYEAHHGYWFSSYYKEKVNQLTTASSTTCTNPDVPLVIAPAKFGSEDTSSPPLTEDESSASDAPAVFEQDTIVMPEGGGRRSLAGTRSSDFVKRDGNDSKLLGAIRKRRENKSTRNLTDISSNPEGGVGGDNKPQEDNFIEAEDKSKTEEEKKLDDPMLTNRSRSVHNRLRGRRSSSVVSRRSPTRNDSMADKSLLTDQVTCQSMHNQLGGRRSSSVVSRRGSTNLTELYTKPEASADGDNETIDNKREALEELDESLMKDNSPKPEVATSKTRIRRCQAASQLGQSKHNSKSPSARRLTRDLNASCCEFRSRSSASQPKLAELGQSKHNSKSPSTRRLTRDLNASCCEFRSRRSAPQPKLAELGQSNNSSKSPPHRHTTRDLNASCREFRSRLSASQHDVAELGQSNHNSKSPSTRRLTRNLAVRKSTMCESDQGSSIHGHRSTNSSKSPATRRLARRPSCAGESDHIPNQQRRSPNSRAMLRKAAEMATCPEGEKACPRPRHMLSKRSISMDNDTSEHNMNASNSNVHARRSLSMDNSSLHNLNTSRNNLGASPAMLRQCRRRSTTVLKSKSCEVSMLSKESIPDLTTSYGNVQDLDFSCSDCDSSSSSSQHVKLCLEKDDERKEEATAVETPSRDRGRKLAIRNALNMLASIDQSSAGNEKERGEDNSISKMMDCSQSSISHSRRAELRQAVSKIYSAGINPTVERFYPDCLNLSMDASDSE